MKNLFFKLLIYAAGNEADDKRDLFSPVIERLTPYIKMSDEVELRAGVGAFAKTDIPADTLLIEIVNGGFISFETALKSLKKLMPTNFVEADDQLDCADTIALFLAIEKNKGLKSPLYDYLQMLPQSFEHQLLNWPEKFDQFFTDQIIYEKRLAIEGYRGMYNSVNVSYNKHNPTNMISPEQFYYARSVVTTRMLEDAQPNIKNVPAWFAAEESCVKLVPVWDMWNHDHEANCDWGNEFEDHDQRRHFVNTTTLVPVKKGDQLFINYGGHTTSNLCLVSDYGFTLSNQPDSIFFSGRERLVACRGQLQLSMDECKIKYNNAYRTTEYSRSEGDRLFSDCSFALTLVQEVTHDYCSTQDVMKIKMLLNMMAARRHQIGKHLFNLKTMYPEGQIDPIDEHYVRMTKDLLKGELLTLEKCKTMFETTRKEILITFFDRHYRDEDEDY